MVDNTQTSKSISLETYGIKNAKVNYQLTPKQLQAITVENGMGKETANGTLAINTGKYTGRSPQDRFLVKDDYTKDGVWWGKTNREFPLKILISCSLKSKTTLAEKKSTQEMVMFALTQNIK